MATIPVLSQPEITISNGRAVTTSFAVAEYFCKRHDNVLRAIANIECSEKFNALNFEDVTYTDAKGEQRPMYQITKNGFVFLVMGFTGKKQLHSRKPTLLNSIAWKNNYGNRNNWPCLLLR